MAITEIAGYRIVRRLGAGGMGQVFLVQHPRLPRQDALKLLDAGVSRNDDFKLRFAREADLLSQLSHPNIVTLHDRGEFEGRLWITMEFIDGADATDLLRERGALAPGLVVELIQGAGAALDYAWRKMRLTHRDVKPANILVGLDRSASPPQIENIKLADFGIAKAAGEATSLTSTGFTVGTMEYISPEAIEGAPLDNRADIYSLGCTAFALLTGAPPFSGTSITALMSAHLTKLAPRISEVAPHLPPSLDQVFAKVLAKNPADRFQSCAEFVAALRAAVDGTSVLAVAPTMSASTAQHAAQNAQYAPTAFAGNPSHPGRSRRPLGWIVAAAAVAVAMVGGGVYALTENDSPESTVAASPSSQPTTHTTTVTAPATRTTATQEPTVASSSEITVPTTNATRPNVLLTVEADTPDVQIAYAPGEWQTYELGFSDLAGRYSMSLNATPENTDSMYIAVRGSTSHHCRIRVDGAVLTTDSGPSQAVCSL